VRRIEPFHFSHRYEASEEERLVAEVQAAYAAGRAILSSERAIRPSVASIRDAADRGNY
jgi:hypothetical protein